MADELEKGGEGEAGAGGESALGKPPKPEEKPTEKPTARYGDLELQPGEELEERDGVAVIVRREFDHKHPAYRRLKEQNRELRRITGMRGKPVSTARRAEPREDERPALDFDAVEETRLASGDTAAMVELEKQKALQADWDRQHDRATSTARDEREQAQDTAQRSYEAAVPHYKDLSNQNSELFKRTFELYWADPDAYLADPEGVLHAADIADAEIRRESAAFNEAEATRANPARPAFGAGAGAPAGGSPGAPAGGGTRGRAMAATERKVFEAFAKIDPTFTEAEWEKARQAINEERRGSGAGPLRMV